MFLRLVGDRNWPAVFGYGLFIGMMAVGYYYNITFVQLGLVDLGLRVVGLGKEAVATRMALLAVFTSAIALAVGWAMQRQGLSSRFFTKLRLACAVVVVQTALTALVPLVQSPRGFLAWIIIASAALGVGVPATFGLTVDLIPTRDRGYVGAIVTAGAYFAAAVLSTRWTIDAFRDQVLWLMVFGSPVLALLALKPLPWTRALAEQHRCPEYGLGRFLRRAAGPDANAPRISRRLIVLIGLMFGIYFIDSLGFLRLLATPIYVENAWLSPDATPRLIIGVAHLLAALVAGVLYANLRERGLFLWIFGIFALVHLTYTFPISLVAPSNQNHLAPAMLYAIAVSLYTVLTFAIWADVSTPETITRNAALGVALSGWTATFVSTALALHWELGQMPVLTHLRVVASLSALFFLALLLWWYFDSGAAAQADRTAAEPEAQADR